MELNQFIDRVNQIQGVRETLQSEYPFEPVDNVLNRFFHSCGRDIEFSLDTLQKDIEWRQRNSAGSVLLKSPDDILGCDVKVIASCFPQFVLGPDKHGRTVLYYLAAYINPEKVLANTTSERYLEYHIWLRESSLARVDYQTLEPPYFQVFIDLKGAKLSQISSSFYSLIAKVADIDQWHYPERVCSVIILNAPVFFTLVWKVVKKFLHPTSIAKVQIVGCNKDRIQNIFQQLLPITSIPTNYGGTGRKLPLDTVRGSSVASDDELFCDVSHQLPHIKHSSRNVTCGNLDAETSIGEDTCAEETSSNVVGGERVNHDIERKSYAIDNKSSGQSLHGFENKACASFSDVRYDNNQETSICTLSGRNSPSNGIHCDTKDNSKETSKLWKGSLQTANKQLNVQHGGAEAKQARKIVNLHEGIQLEIKLQLQLTQAMTKAKRIGDDRALELNLIKTKLSEYYTFEKHMLRELHTMQRRCFKLTSELIRKKALHTVERSIHANESPDHVSKCFKNAHDEKLKVMALLDGFQAKSNSNAKRISQLQHLLEQVTNNTTDKPATLAAA